MFDIYTDGSCLGNPGPGGAAWALFMKGEPLSAGDIVEPNMTTNNRMELRGLIDALRALDDQGMPFGQPDVYLRLDSQYVLNGIFMYMPGWIEKNWKKVANDDLFKQIHCLLTGLRAKGYVFHSAWVKAHTTGAAAANPINAQNNILDKRARDAANRAAQIMQDAEIVAYVAETHDEIHGDVPATSPDTWEPKAPSGFINVIVDAPQEAPDDMALLAARMILTAARNPNTTPETLLARIHAMRDDLGL